MGTQPPPEKGGGAPIPNFQPMSIVAKRLDAPRCHLVWSGPGDFVLDGDPKRRQSPQFSAHVYCGQRAGWIKMVFGMEVGLGPVHIVLDGDTAPLPQKGQSPPIFGPSLLWPNGWMHQDAAWYGGRPQPRRLCVRWGPCPLPKKEAEPGGRTPNFRPMSIVAKRLDESRWQLA